MTLTELQQEVYTLTNRSDLVAETLAAVRAATLKIHHSDFYDRDLFETGISFVNPLYLQQIDYKFLVPRYRALKYIRKTDASGQENGTLFTVITPDSVLDDYKLNRTDVCYLAGSVIQLRSSTQVQYCLFGCYRHPDITVTHYDSWVATDYPFSIIYEAAATVFKMIGDTDQFAAYTRLADIQLAEVRLSNIQANGY
jgi:hypothetical protein